MKKEQKLDEGILWYRAIDPISGKIVQEETFLGAALEFVIAFALGCFVLWLAQFL